MLTLIEITAALAGLCLAVLLTLFPRFGSASWTLAAFLVPGLLSVGVLGGAGFMGWSVAESAFFSFLCLLLCGAGGCLSSYTLGRDNYAGQFRKHWWFFSVIALLAPALVTVLYVFRDLPPATSDMPEALLLGPGGYGAAAYLLLVSVIALANVEQTLRSSEEHVRWEIKFLLLGLASVFGAMVYVASRILLYAPEYSFLSLRDIRIFPVIFLCSCLLILQSWRRATGHTHVVVSHGVIHSTITLFGVGLYLIGSSLLARWANQWIQPGIPAEPVIFLISVAALAVVLLGTTFRHRARRWIRQNVFAGRFDYRQFWMGANERVRATDSPAVAAAALAELIESALGSLDISVWLRSHNSDTFHLMAARGRITGSLPPEAPGLLGPLTHILEPVPVSELDDKTRKEWPGQILEQTKASLLVPLISSGRVIGLITIGADRSGRPFDREAREFLRVLALHSASEFHKSELLATLVAAREAEAFHIFSTFLLHDLKNFASTLSLIARNAARHHANPDFQRDAFQSVLDTSEKIKNLCNSLRTFSSTLATNKRVHDLNQIVKAVAETFDSGLSRHLELELGDIPAVVVDGEEITRVLQNLILNAHEASGEGTIRFSTKLEGNAVVIRVNDHGKGIPREFMERKLFQPFHTTKVDGLGIGLFQSKKIVEAHDGTIEVRSTEGEGTEVRVILPLVRDVRSQTTPATKHEERELLAKTQIAD